MCTPREKAGEEAEVVQLSGSLLLQYVEKCHKCIHKLFKYLREAGGFLT